MPAFNNATVIAALIAAIVSLLIAIFNFFSTRGNQSKLKALEEKQAEKDARRDYEYEARKRLYQQYEPLSFQLAELSEAALWRITGLARTASQGNLGPYDTWLSPDNDYLKTTIHRLLAPLVIIRLIQHRLTLVDLTVDPRINSQYTLAKYLSISFREDFELAHIEPRLPYDPYNKKIKDENRKTHPETYWRQGIPADEVDKAVAALIFREPDGNLRCMNYGEFEDIFTQDRFESFRYIFTDFHPKTRPILWRILITQAHIYEALLRASEIQISASDNRPEPILKRAIRPLAKEDRLKFDWRQPGEKVKDEEVLSQPFDVALKYLQMYVDHSWSYRMAAELFEE